MNQMLNLGIAANYLQLQKGDFFLKKIALVLMGVLLLTISSKISIPLGPVPLTFQSITVVLIGMLYGARYGAYVIFAYLFSGIAGFPVFAGAPFGIACLFGPTGGYLMGFLPAVIVSAYFSQKGWAKSFPGCFAASFCGVSIIFLSGVAMLSTFTGITQAFRLGVQPFLFTELAKLVMAAILLPRFLGSNKKG